MALLEMIMGTERLFNNFLYEVKTCFFILGKKNISNG
jgi:hypothetical protein